MLLAGQIYPQILIESLEQRGLRPYFFTRWRSVFTDMTTHFLQPGEQPASVSYDELANQLAGRIHPSEIHGYLCGLLSSGQALNEQQWLDQLEQQVGDDGFDDAARQLSGQLFARTHSELASGSFAVPLLLPDDDDALAIRAEALGIWCQSFISGFGQGLQGAPVSEMAEEVLRDLAEIALIEPADEGEESERLFIEVSEFVRLAWLNVYAELGGQASERSSGAGENSGRVHKTTGD